MAYNGGGEGFNAKGMAGGGGGGNTTYILQYVVALSSGTGQPVNGASSFTATALQGFGSIAVSSTVFLQNDVQYSYDAVAGTINLLGGLLFNYGEYYTIFGTK